MITYSDDDYKATKLIMQGKAFMNPEFIPLANWINNTYGLKPINIIYDLMEPEHSPRLQICFEFPYEKEKFYENGAFLNFDKGKQTAICAEFKKTMKEQGLIRNSFFSNPFKRATYRTNGIFAYFSAFEPIAREEANGSIPNEHIKSLEKEINDENLWQIVTVFAGAVFFLYTDEQVKQYDKEGIKKAWSEKYYALLKDYDEFNYFKDKFSIYIDSKENFDQKYNSSWYNYFH
jgi:hypothetical protein